LKALILAAGCDCLRPLTDKASSLLPCRAAIADWILDRIAGSTTSARSTSSRTPASRPISSAGRTDAFAFTTTARPRTDRSRYRRHRLVADREEWEGEELLVIAGDNLFDFSLAAYVDFWRSKDGSAIAVYDHPDRELVSEYSVVELDQDDRVVGFEEKPERPASNLISIATYLYHRAHFALLRAYLAEGNPPDQPGYFIAWLYTRAPVYGYRFSGEWLDIGNRSQLLEADNRYRRRAGLPERDQYLLD
jgi:hypothetical protein